MDQRHTCLRDTVHIDGNYVHVQYRQCLILPLSLSNFYPPPCPILVYHFNKDAEENHTEKIENFCPHMVRHTYTSLAYSAGADVKIVSQNLGHASTSVTLDTYTHLTEDKKKEQEAVAQTVRIS